MAVIRRNIVSDAHSRDQYIAGVKRLKQEFLPGATAGQLGIAGANTATPISTYDLFVVWHHRAMSTPVPPGANTMRRNAAHRGPIFLPWHRFFLIVLEQQLQRVLGDPGFGLPYWDWAADGELGSIAKQIKAPLWKDVMGGFGYPVKTGPFAFQPTDPQTWRVVVFGFVDGTIGALNGGKGRGLQRDATRPIRLPTKQQVTAALQVGKYDHSDWDVNAPGFRNTLEGFLSAAAEPELHNRVHVWIGGDMGPSSSPNDPVFFLNHCNIDRIWEAWMAEPDHGRVYLPGQHAPGELKGHRIDDPLEGPIAITGVPGGGRPTARKLLDPAPWYHYDTLPA